MSCQRVLLLYQKLLEGWSSFSTIEAMGEIDDSYDLRRQSGRTDL